MTEQQQNGNQNGTQNANPDGQQNTQHNSPPPVQQQTAQNAMPNSWTPNTPGGGHYGNDFSAGTAWGQLQSTLAGLPEAVSRAVRESFPTGTPNQPSSNDGQNANQNNSSATDGGSTSNNNNAPAGTGTPAPSGGQETVTPGRGGPNRFAKWWFGL